MNKLVSKNPVLRFKLGKKIVKALLGSILSAIAGSVTNRYLNRPTNNTKKRVKAKIGYGPVPGVNPDGTLDHSITYLKWNEDPNTGKFISGLYVKNGNKYWYGSDRTTTLIGPNDGPIKKPIRPSRRKKPIRPSRRKKPVVSSPIITESVNHPEDTLPVSDFLSKQENLILSIPTAPAASVQGRLGKPYGSYWSNNTNTMLTDENDVDFLRNNLKMMPKLRTPSITYDRSGTRDWIKNNLGRGAYDFTGALRRALRYWLNGDKEGTNYDKNLLGVFGDLSLYAKQGAKLVSRNPIERFLQGRNLPTAPKAEDRYKNGRRTWNMPQYKEVSSASNIFGDPFASRIAMEVNDNNDTTFYETPGRWLPVKFKTRTATRKNLNFKPLNPYSGRVEDKHILISPEYEILKRRFNTAWNLAK